MACHAVDRKVVGPAFKEIAKKYKNDPGAQDKLSGDGKAGVWGQIPCPRLAKSMPDADRQAVTAYIRSR